MNISLKHLLFIITLTCCLQGCVAVVGGAAVGTAGAAVLYDRRDMKVILDDENISYRIVRAIEVNSTIREQCHIVVSTYRGVVLLAGQAPTQELKDEIEEIAKKAGGFTKLYNEISIEGPTSNLTRSSDTWITTKIKSELLVTKHLQSGQFKVVTENGIVYLMGVVTHSQSQLATDVIREIDGVQKIVTLFQYKYTNESEDTSYQQMEKPIK